MCLLAPGTHEWDPEQTIAHHLHTQLPQVLRAAATPGQDELEAAEAESAKRYLEYLPISAVIVPFDLHGLDGVDRGTFTLGLQTTDAGALVNDTPTPIVRGVVLDIRDEADKVLLASDVPDGSLRTVAHVTARWSRLARRPEGSSREVFDAARRLNRETVPASARNIDVAWQGHEWRLEAFAVVYEDALRYGTSGTDMVVMVRRTAGPSLLGPERSHAYLRTYPLTESLLRERTPELAGLAGKSVLQIGLGGLGAPLALHLGRAGVGRMTVGDMDVIDPATTVRHPGTVSDAGQPKAPWVVAMLRHQNPWIEAASLNMGIGIPRTNGKQPRQDLTLSQLVARHDIVVDASAEDGLNEELAVLAHDAGVPYVAVSATEGGWGGRIVRITADACFGCYIAMTQDPMRLPRPPADPAGVVEPTGGCSAPTFTAAGFDLAPLSAHAARMVCSTLLRDIEGGYPPLPYDVAILRLRADSGAPVEPQWETFTVDEQQDCQTPHWH